MSCVLQVFDGLVHFLLSEWIIVIIIITRNLIYIVQLDTDGILKVLYITVRYIQMQCVHI